MPREFLGCTVGGKKKEKDKEKEEEKERNPHSQPEVTLKTGDRAWKSSVNISMDKV